MGFLIDHLSRAIRSTPKILLLVDYRGWAYDHSALELSRQLADDFDFEIKYVHDSPKPKLKAGRYDLIYVFFWGETYHRKFGFSPTRTIKAVSSHRWEDDPRFGPCAADEMVRKFLADAETVLCTSERLLEIVMPHHPRAFHTPNGINIDKFKRHTERTGSIKIGWAGNIDDPVKGMDDILRPACEGQFKLAIAPGNLTHNEMNKFYNELDVLAVASKHEGEPLTLLEAMAAGCFPVCTDVGIVPELIEHKVNGFIVNERRPQSMRDAFIWCEAHKDYVRKAGHDNSVRIRKQRDWAVAAQHFKKAFNDTLAHVNCS